MFELVTCKATPGDGGLKVGTTALIKPELRDRIAQGCPPRDTAMLLILEEKLLPEIRSVSHGDTVMGVTLVIVGPSS